jgi:hypothetical protein
MIPAAPSTGIAAPLNKPARVEKIDSALQTRVSARDIPGVVAMAANDQSVVKARSASATWPRNYGAFN